MNLQAAKLAQVSVLLIALLFALSNQLALAQVSSSISGRVEDPSGAAIPGATVTVTSLETGAARTLAADPEGNFQVLALGVGRYEVRAQKEGFKAVVQTGINLAVAQQAVVNIKLEVGAVQEQVTVTSEASLVNTTTSSVAGLVGERQVKDLPLNGRSFDLLITLNPGTINYTAMKAAGQLTGGNEFSVAGRRPSENLTLWNGVEYTGAGNAAVTPGGASGQLLGIDAVREYNVVTDTYGAEYGKRAGGQVSVVTQSGTNQLHGSLFEFLRNSDLDARNFFDQKSIPAFKRNQFGGSAGGPIRKDRTFIFGSYEGFRQRLGISDVTFVPDSNARLGLLPCVAGGVPACAAGVSVGTPTQVPNLEQRMLPYLNAFWPEPNGPVLGGGVAETFSNPAQSIREDFGNVRFDHTLSDKDSLSAAYTIDDGFNLTPGVNPFTGKTLALRNQIISLQETHIFSPQVINSLTVGFSRTSAFAANPSLVPFPANLYFEPGSISPGSINLGTVGGNSSSNAGLSVAGNISPFSLFARSLFTYSDGIQVIKGKHQFSAGVWFQRIRANDNDPLNGSGQATFSNFASLLQGTVSTFTVAPRTIALGWRSWEAAWYVQDSIQLRSNLTLRLGLRHEFSNGWNEVNGLAQTVLFDQSGVVQTLPKQSHQFTTDNNSKWLFGPRVGLAWDPFGKGKTSVRAGFGTYYDLVDTLGYFPDITAPLNGAASFSNMSLFSLIPINTSFVPPPCGPGVPNPCNIYLPRTVQSSYKVPTVESWNFMLEQQLTQNTAIHVAYVGFQSYHDFITLDPNSILGQICSNPAGCVSGGVNSARGLVPQGAEYIPVGTRPNPFLSWGLFGASEGPGNYNALQVEVTRRRIKGLQFRANYTWSKNLDIMSGTTATQSNNEAQGVLDPANLLRDWGPAALNVKHQVSGNLSYELPFGQGKVWLSGAHGLAEKLVGGWQLNVIATFLSGFPFTPLIGSNVSGNGDLGGEDRPSLNPAFTGPVVVGSPNEWYNPKAFALPTPGTFGNVGRGAFNGPGLANLDASLFKNTHISERIGLQFRGEVFNVLNRSNFGPPNLGVFAGSVIGPAAGFITRTATASRQIQFGLKLIF